MRWDQWKGITPKRYSMLIRTWLFWPGSCHSSYELKKAVLCSKEKSRSPGSFLDLEQLFPELFFGHGKVEVLKSTGVSHGVRPSIWGSLETWELQIPCFEVFLWGENTLGIVPSTLSLSFARIFKPSQGIGCHGCGNLGRVFQARPCRVSVCIS